MIITSLKQHFPARAPEWLNGVIILGLGIYVLEYPDLMYAGPSSRIWNEMTKIVSQATWGWIWVAMGAVRLTALFVNGAYTRTPLIRVVVSFMSAFVWTQLVLGIYRTGVPSTGLITYSGLLLADIISAFRAGTDVTYASMIRRKRAEYVGVHSS